MTLSAVSLLGWAHVLFFGVGVPATVLRTKRRLDAGLEVPPFDRHIIFASLQLIALSGVSVLVARVERIELFPARAPAAGQWLWGAGFYAAAVAVMALQWRRTVERGGPVLRLFTPRSRRDRALWVMASAVAGVGEEITWRGVQFALLWQLSGDPVIAAVICAVMFGAAHAVQGRAASAAVMVFALGFHALVSHSGSLYVAMTVHFAYNVTAGFTYGRLAERRESASRAVNTSSSPAAPG